MAGGRGERMRRSGVDAPKPLVTVAGTSLLERNVRVLLHWGFDRIVVSTPSAEPSIGSHVEALQPVVAAAGGDLRTLTESEPLGNIGCAGLLRGHARHVLVVFADNLTSLDLRTVVQGHRDSGAGLTLAAHEHGVRVPYGRLDLEGDRVVGYTEKPTVQVTVASAITVLGPEALAALPGDEACGLVDLTRRLVHDGVLVRAHRHEADWVDVNDSGGLEAAEALVRRHPEFFLPAP
jgi:mannose-1-phosphate guanylyltransferase